MSTLVIGGPWHGRSIDTEHDSFLVPVPNTSRGYKAENTSPLDHQEAYVKVLYKRVRFFHRETDTKERRVNRYFRYVFIPADWSGIRAEDELRAFLFAEWMKRDNVAFSEVLP